MANRSQSFYGMNFFGFDAIKKQIVMGEDFWIFIATWLPLTFLTGAIYLFVLFLGWRAKEGRQSKGQGKVTSTLKDVEKQNAAGKLY
jgi:hypothetical protein